MSTSNDRMTCEDRLPDLVTLALEDGAGLAADVRAALEAHVAGCATCRSELEALRSGDDLVSGTREEPAPLLLAGFATRTADAAEAFRDRSARGWWWSLTRGMRFAAAGSALGFASSFALAAFVLTRPEPEPRVVVQFTEAPRVADTRVTQEPETLVREAMVVPSGLDADSAFEALDDAQLDAMLDRLAAGG